MLLDEKRVTEKPMQQFRECGVRGAYERGCKLSTGKRMFSFASDHKLALTNTTFSTCMGEMFQASS